MIETILSIILASRFSTGSNLLVEGEKFITHKNFDTQIIKDDTMIAPIITAKSAIVTDLEGNILFELNSNEQVPMASLTKLMTTYIILEENNLEDIVKVSQKAASEQGSRMGLHTGEEISVKNLLYGAFLNSGNDSATALAEHNAGSVLAFVEKMNQKANELGLYNTNFKNPTGIDQTDHYSSANDIAKLAKKIFENDFLQEAVKTKTIKVKSVNGNISHNLKNTNDLLDSYLTVLGLKTGTTPMAGECLSAITKLDNGKLIITVVLGSTNRFKDSKILVDWTNRAYFAKNTEHFQPDI